MLLLPQPLEPRQLGVPRPMHLGDLAAQPLHLERRLLRLLLELRLCAPQLLHVAAQLLLGRLRGALVRATAHLLRLALPPLRLPPPRLGQLLRLPQVLTQLRHLGRRGGGRLGDGRRGRRR